MTTLQLRAALGSRDPNSGYPGIFDKFAHMPGTAVTRKRDHQIGLILDQHSLISDQCRVAALFEGFDVGRWGYGLTEARRNSDLDVVMFRANDPRRKTFEACLDERKNLRGLLEEIMVNEQTIEVWPIVKGLRSSILPLLQE